MTKFIAHRGYSKFEKENTIPAFVLAGKCEYFYGIETDCHVSKDGIYIIMHDDNTLRITNEKIDYNIELNDYNETRKIILPDLNGEYDRHDLYIPKMIEYFEVCKKYNKIAVFELKQEFSLKQLNEIIDIINGMNYLENTIFISFIFENLKNLRSLNKDVKIQFLTYEWKEEYYDLLNSISCSLDIYYELINKEMIYKCHERNIEVNCWTVDDKLKAKKLIDMGVDYITSNALNSDDLK